MPKHSPFRDRNLVATAFRNMVQGFRRCAAQLKLRQKLRLGSNVCFARNVDLRPPQMLEIGDDVSFGQNVIVETNLTVGPDTLISSNVAFIGNDHAFDDPNSTVYWQGRLPPCHVVLEGDNLIGFGSIIVGNVVIGRGCIVGAGSVVTKNLPQNSICVGVPARPVKPRFASN